MTIVKIETYVWLDKEGTDDAEEATKIALAVGDSLFAEGYGNVAAEDPKETTLSVVLIASEAESDDWKDAIRAKGVMGIDFPTSDPKFVKQLDDGKLEALVLG
jgi:hypothetical protein